MAKATVNQENCLVHLKLCLTQVANSRTEAGWLDQGFYADVMALFAIKIHHVPNAVRLR